jgi:hypothetical protein
LRSQNLPGLRAEKPTRTPVNKCYEKTLASTENILTTLASPKTIAIKDSRWKCHGRWEISVSEPALLFGMRRDALADFSQQLPSACRIAALLAHHKTGFSLALGDDVRDKVVKQPLHTRAGGSRRAQQRFVP